MPVISTFLPETRYRETTVARYFGQILRNLGMLKRGHVVEYTATDLMNEVFNRENNGDFAKLRRSIGRHSVIDEAYLLEQDKQAVERIF